MANPTTNYGFVLPTPTDLVTDLPADFDVALQGVDTRLKALQPGTTAGDLAYSSATANTNVRLGIGTSGQVLAVSGGGVPAWTTTAAGMDLIKQAAFSNVASTTTTFDAMFSSTYLSYLITIDTIFAAIAGDDLQVQLRYSTTTENAGYYGSALQSPTSGSTLTITNTNNASALTLSSSTGASAGVGNGYFFISNVSGTSALPSINGMFNETNAVGQPGFFGGAPSTARIYTGFLVKSSSSNITGTVSVYGLAK